MLYKTQNNEDGISIIIYVVIIAIIFSAFFQNYLVVHFILFTVSLLFVLKGGIRGLYFFTLYTFLQNIFLIAFSPTLTSWDTKLIILYKEIIVYLSAFFYLAKYQFKNEGIIQKIVLILVAFIFLFNLIRPGAPFNLKLIAIRQLLIPYMGVYFGYSIATSKIDLLKYMRFYINSLCFLGVIGLFIYQFEPYIIWDSLNYPQYFFNKNDASFDTGYLNFYSWDFGPQLKRFVSIIADPIAAAHMVGIALVYLIVVEKGKSFWKKILMMACAIFCVSKSLILLFFTIGLVVFYVNIKKKIYKILFFSLAIISIFILFTLATLYVEGLESNTASGNHLKSLIFAVYNNSFLGNGLGSAGYLAGVITGQNIEMDANESFMAMLITQLGILGATVFYLYFILKILQMEKLYHQTNSRIVLFGLILLTDVILESIVSGSSIAMLGTGLYFIIPGMIMRNFLVFKSIK